MMGIEMGGGEVEASYPTRIFRVTIGQFFYAIGSYLSIQANIGLAPWSAFSMGITYFTPFSYGDVIILSGLVILAIDLLLRERIGLGTLLDILLMGKFVDLFQYLGIVPLIENFFVGVIVLLVGQFSIALGTYFYVGAGMCCGPRDALMVALGKRLKRFPIGLVRGLIEGTALLLGWLMGAKVGLGTVIAVFGISFILEATFRALRFDVTAVVHEDLRQTWHRLRAPKRQEGHV